jgi:quercetin dioxygenase-like cupin family protein
MPLEVVARGQAATEEKPRAYWLFSDLVVVHVSGEETDGRYCLLEWLQPPEDMTPLHVHRRDSQTIYVLEGELTVYLPGMSRVLRRGECIHQPAGVPQTGRVTSTEPARVLDINSPAGFDKFIAAAGKPTATLTLPPPPERTPDLERLARVAAEHDIDLLGPPGSLP